MARPIPGEAALSRAWPLIPVISSSVYARNLVVRTLPWHPTASAKATAVCSSGHSPTEIRSHSPSVQWIASVI